MNRWISISSLMLCAGVTGLCAVHAHEVIPEGPLLKRQYTEVIRPLLQNYCIRCHGPEDSNGDLRLDSLSDELSEANIHAWNTVKNMLDVGDMPPKKQTHRPTREEQERIINWIGGSLKRYAADHLETGGDTLVRRINRRAYVNMIRTLLDVPAQCLEEFPDDGAVHGFDTVGSGLYTNSYLFELYMKSAQRTLDIAISADPKPPPVKEYSSKLKTSWGNWIEGGCQHIDRSIKDLLADPDKFMTQDFVNLWGAGNINKVVADQYNKKTLDEVKAAGIDWTRDPQCTTKVVDGLKADCKQRRLNVEMLDDFQDITQDFHDVVAVCAVPGYYQITARLCVSNPRCPIPVRLETVTTDSANNFTKQFMVNESREEARLYEMKAFLGKGKYHVEVAANPHVNYIKEIYGVAVNRPVGHWWVFKDLTCGNNFKPDATAEEQTKNKLSNVVGVLAAELTVRGPIYESWPPPATSRIFPRGVNAPPSREYAEEIVTAFMKRAYGGVCDAASAKAYTDLVMNYYESRKDFVQAVKYGLAAVLCSPRFLYLDEDQRTDSSRRKPLNAFELGRRLAYFLWSDLPDDALIASASSGALLNEQELTAQTRRMLKDARSRAFREAFTKQWLKIDKMNGFSPSGDLFPGFDRVLLESAQEESVAFFTELLDKNLSIANFIDSDFTMLNGRLALHYGIPGVAGDEFRRVQLPAGSHRGGVLSQASVLMATSNAMVSSPVRRGVFIMDRLLGDPPGAPPPDVPALDQTPSSKKDGALLTQTERLSLHRENISCARCHDKIDPLGAGLENYNALGAWNSKLALLRTGKGGRQQWEPHDADVRGALADGTPFNGAAELKQRLLEHTDQFARCFNEHLATYALGRSLELSDQPVLEQLCARAKASNYGLSTIVEQIVLSELFRNK